jgi:hypothetical protein
MRSAVSIYGYKADGLRLYKETAGERVTHVWDGGGMVLELNADKRLKTDMSGALT